jgi:hypothetical protein
MKDYPLSIMNYKKAIKRLRQYKGSNKYPLHLISLLEDKINEIQEEEKQNETVLHRL